MCAFFFRNWQKPVGVFIAAFMLVSMIVQPAAAAESDKSWYTVTVDPVSEKACIGRRLLLFYTIKFDGFEYCRDKKCGKAGPTSTVGPIIKVTANSETLAKYNEQLETQDTTTFTHWREYVVFTPKKAGKVSVTIKTNFFNSSASDKWEFTVSDPCPMDIEIHANQSSARLPSGKTVEEAVKPWWGIFIYLEGKARIISDPIDQGSGSGGEQRPVGANYAVLHMEDATGTMDFFGDGIWLGAEKEFTCGTKGALTCSREFTVHPVPGDETINFQIDNKSGQCSSFTVWCEGEGGHAETTIPPMSSLAFQMNAEIPREGGSAHYIHQLPYGVTMDYLISAFPVEE